MSLNKTKVILLSCGSFNPITHMHLRLFEIARDALHSTGLYSVVEGIISPVNDDYGKKDLIKSKHRKAMCDFAVQSSNWIRVDDWEIKQSKWTRTAAVLKHFKEEAKGKYLEGSVQVKLLCGADLLESFAVPDLWSDEDMEIIVKNHGIIVITRQGSNPEQFIYDSDRLTRYKNNIHIVTEWITNNISATRIRRAIRRNESVKYLVPEKVIEYIQENELYKENN